MPSRTALAPMRLAYLATAYPYASQTFIRREILELERRGHTVLRVGIRRGPSVDPIDKSEGDRAFILLEQGAFAIALAVLRTALQHPGPFARMLRVAWQMQQRSDRGWLRHVAYVAEACVLLRHLRANGVRHLHVHFGTNAASVARLLHHLEGPCYSMTVHGPEEFDGAIGHSLGPKVEDAVFTAAITSFARAQQLRWVAIEHWSRIHIVRCTVGDHSEQPVEGIRPDNPTLVSVGRLAPEKGQPLLIDAMARLRTEGVEARLLLVGDGPLRGALEQQIAEASLGDRVRITGWVSDKEVHQFLVDARALVSASFAEGLPVVIMEALAAARPVIATYIAGIPELVVPGESGWLVPAGDVDALTAALRDALRMPTAKLDAMGRTGRDRVLRNHSTATEVDTLEGLLARLADVRQSDAR
jgi:colanic acid/amylovoran biosynthesis glycosyltransferase